MRIRGRARTLRGRVSTLAVVVIAGWLVVLAAGFDLVIASRIDTQVDDALRVRAEAASATVIVSAGRITGVRESATDSELDSSIWVFSGDTSIERPNADARRQRAADALARADTGYHDSGDERFYVLPVRSRGARIGSVIAAIDREPYDRTRDLVVVGSIVVVGLLALGAYPVLTLATGRALRPVARMTQQAAEWSVTAPNERFGHAQEYAELNSLAVTLDELLDRLAAVLRHERQLSAELSHELRTPLARVSAEVDLLAEDIGPAARRPDVAAALDSIRAGCATMDSIMDTLLAAARSELVGTVGRCQLAPVLQAFAARDPSVVTAGSTGLTAGVEADMVARMLNPVVDNALRFARSQVQLTARRDGTGVVVEVVNDGPLLDPQLAEQVFEPGFSRPAAGAPAHDGAGLGLALARRLARSVDGDLTVDASATRTTFLLALPAG